MIGCIVPISLLAYITETKATFGLSLASKSLSSTIPSLFTLRYVIYKLSSFQLVPKYSAVIPGAINAEEIALPADHRNIVKFFSLEDEGFKKVSGRTALAAKGALDEIRENRKIWEDIKGSLVKAID